MMGEHPSLLSVCASTRVYARGAADGWINLRLGAAMGNFEKNKFHRNNFFNNLNVVDMACWINSHQEKSKKIMASLL